jgi:hypothetical protein
LQSGGPRAGAARVLYYWRGARADPAARLAVAGFLTAEERPDLWAQANDGFARSWPAYNMHGNHAAVYFGELFPRFARFHVLVYDRSANRVVGRVPGQQSHS